MQSPCLGIEVFHCIDMGYSMAVSLWYNKWVSFSSAIYGLLRGFQHAEIGKHLPLPVSIVTPGA